VRINKLALTNFRSYNSLELELQPGVITFIGDNGSGKTNIAESLIYLAFLSSHLSLLETNRQLSAQRFNAKTDHYKSIWK
jgi:recombinational DNA repair ATPase RecF